MWRHQGQRAHSRPIMLTEYQDKFLPPRCHTAHILGSKHRHPYQQDLKSGTANKEDIGMRASSADGTKRTQEMPSFRSFYMAQKLVNHPSKLPPVTNSNPMSPKKCCCAQFCPTCSKEAKEDQLSVYRRDFQEWKVSKREPYRLHDNLKVYQGVGAEELNSKERQPMEATTSYRCSFICHPVQPRKNSKPGNQTSSFQLGHTTPKCCGHCTDVCNGMVNHFNSWKLETKFPRDGKDDKHNVDGFHTTMRTDFTEHKLQRRKPIIPEKQRKERSKEPFEGITTMREDYRKWDLPRRPSKDTKKDWRKGFDQISFSVNTPEASHCKRCHQNLKDSNKSTDVGTVEFERMAAGTTGDAPRSTNGVATWMKCDMNKDQTQMVSCMISA